jgi:hypothetical protein
VGLGRRGCVARRRVRWRESAELDELLEAILAALVPVQERDEVSGEGRRAERGNDEEGKGSGMAA